MSDLKTQPNDKDVVAFIQSLESEKRRQDASTLLQVFGEITKKTPVMWGESIIGFGQYHYKYATGREGDWLLTGFSPRKSNMTIYIMLGFSNYEDYLSRLGKHKTGKSCLYINKLDDIDLEVLKQLIQRSVQDMYQIYSCQ